ncbi:MAG: hypothetical protein RL536_484 [Candidatus Parcubacteria bacterium]|jgi:type II secretory pathway component PulF
MFKQRKWKNRDTILLLERLELYISSGLTIDKTLSIASQGISKRQKISVENIRSQVISGTLLSKALVANIGISKTLSGLVEHGESSGELARALGTSRKLLERGDELTKKCLSALAYPIIIGIFSLLLTFGLVRGVMPQIIPMLKSLHVQLPLLTRFVMSVSENIIAYGLQIFAAITLIAGLLIFAYKKSRKFRAFSHAVFIRVPIIGPLIYNYSLSLFLQSCGALVDSGIQISQSVVSTAGTVSLLPLSKFLLDQQPQIRKGISLGQIFMNKTKRIPNYVAPLLIAGEASGSLGQSLIRVASIIDRDMEYSLKRITSLIEPVMMAGMGCVVGGIALSIMMPIYDISRVLQH